MQLALKMKNIHLTEDSHKCTAVDALTVEGAGWFETDLDGCCACDAIIMMTPVTARKRLAHSLRPYAAKGIYENQFMLICHKLALPVNVPLGRQGAHILQGHVSVYKKDGIAYSATYIEEVFRECMALKPTGARLGSRKYVSIEELVDHSVVVHKKYVTNVKDYDYEPKFLDDLKSEAMEMAHKLVAKSIRRDDRIDSSIFKKKYAYYLKK